MYTGVVLYYSYLIICHFNTYKHSHRFQAQANTSEDMSTVSFCARIQEMETFKLIQLATGRVVNE